MPEIIGKTLQVFCHSIPYTTRIPIHKKTGATTMGNKESW
jgi:hypothetical protein